MRWVIAYDVTLDSHRRRIAKRLEQMGFRRQKSVFEGDASPKEIQAIFSELEALLDLETDVLTAWPTSENGHAQLQHRGRERDITHCSWKLI